MATVRLHHLKGLNPAVRRKIRDTLRAQSQAPHGDTTTLPNSQTSTSKWRNVRTTVDGLTFASKREARRYAELKIELLAGNIAELELQKPFALDINGIHICDDVADFVYPRQGVQIVADAKGKATDLYRIKQALMRAIYDIEIVEV